MRSLCECLLLAQFFDNRWNWFTFVIRRFEFILTYFEWNLFFGKKKKIQFHWKWFFLFKNLHQISFNNKLIPWKFFIFSIDFKKFLHLFKILATVNRWHSFFPSKYSVTRYKHKSSYECIGNGVDIVELNYTIVQLKHLLH